MNTEIEFIEDVEKYLKKHKRYFITKRGLDILISIFALTLLSPLFLVTAVAIKIDSKGKVIFSQQRSGKDGKPFIMYKFRSMEEGAEAKRKDLMDKNEMDGPVFKIFNDPRVTRVGRIIRKYSIDELPQLYNVLRGEMSIVGPRPLVVYEANQLTDYENKRHIIKPGLTCYWQIRGRNNLHFDDWIKLDFKYIREMSTRTDLKIILQTFHAVLSKKGAG